MFIVTDAGEWAEKNFGLCELGDKRRRIEWSRWQAIWRDQVAGR
jgi:hypothetical protein